MKNKMGISMIVIGSGHTLLGLVRFQDQFVAMLFDGLISSGAGELRGWAFWFTLSGVLMITLGVSIRSLEIQNALVPKSLGWLLLGISILGAAVFPLSGFWLILAVSLAILFGSPAYER